MRCRLYLPGTADARVLDLLLDNNRHGDVRLSADRIIVSTGDDDVPSGCLVWRPTAYIHEFLVPNCLGQRTIADSLYREAVKLDIGRRHLIRQAVWLVDNSNARMLRYARDVGAIEQNGTVFLLNLKPSAPGATTYEGNGQVGERVEAG
jgi:hypothetical protein